MNEKYFYNYINKQNVKGEYLPLFHSTKAKPFLEILDSDLLITEKCEVFNEELLYFFYGRPAYKVSKDIGPCGIKDLLPVCIIVDVEKVESIKKIYPFDTGAFAKRLYSEILYGYNLSEFNLGDSKEIAPKYINTFFNNNYSYYWGMNRKAIDNDAPMIADTFHTLISEESPKSFDDRKYTLEFVVDKDVKISECAKAIIIPRCLMSKPEYSRKLLKLSCDILHYNTVNGFAPDQYCTSIFDMALDYLDIES